MNDQQQLELWVKHQIEHWNNSDFEYLYPETRKRIMQAMYFQNDNYYKYVKLLHSTCEVSASALIDVMLTVKDEVVAMIDEAWYIESLIQDACRIRISKIIGGEL